MPHSQSECKSSFFAIPVVMTKRYGLVGHRSVLGLLTLSCMPSLDDSWLPSQGLGLRCPGGLSPGAVQV